ncbi:MAG: flavin reductase family protein [Erysipelotrichaceae bacterium]|nr:flavin reductase family protein [Erysipelotrichaceae bacterium]
MSLENYPKVAAKFVSELPTGIFLTAQKDGIANSMVIGWATIGRVWSRPTVTIYVRPQRYTHDLLEKATSFTVSIPAHGELKEAIRVLGTESGRNQDKHAKCNLTLHESLTVDTPYIEDCEAWIECRIMYRQWMHDTDDPVISRQYPEKDYHEILYGEILHCGIRE